MLTNDTDVDAGTTLTATLGREPGQRHGDADAGRQLHLHARTPNFNGTDSFTYTASDGTAVSNVATVTITVAAVNDAPVAVNDRRRRPKRRAASAATC